MRAIGVTEFGGPDVLRVVDKPARAAGAGEVRIRVAAAAVNPADLLMRAGRYAAACATFDPPYVFGMDAAGVIESVGAGIDRLTIGEAVMACAPPVRPEGGAYNELLVVKAASVAPIPDGASFAQAATLPMNGLTAIEALRTLDLPAGATLAVTGGAGWLAALTLRLAKLQGLRTIADAHPRDHDVVRSWGADEVVDRGEGLTDRIRALAPGGVDGALDAALIGPPLLPAIRDGGVWAVVRVGLEKETVRGIACRYVNVFNRMEDTDALLRLRDLATHGALPMRVAAEYPPDKAADAHRRMAAGGVRGRLVIVF